MAGNGKKQQSGAVRTEEEEEEGLVVGVSDAIVCPWAVVVHAKHTRATNGAMMRTWWLGLLALLAVPRAAAFFLHLQCTTCGPACGRLTCTADPGAPMHVTWTNIKRFRLSDTYVIFPNWSGRSAFRTCQEGVHLDVCCSEVFRIMLVAIGDWACVGDDGKEVTL
jgi:hypothetical protein